MRINPKYDLNTNRHFLPQAPTEKVLKVIEIKLGECVQRIAGRWPSARMIDKHGCKLIQPSGNWTFTWKAKKILRVDFYPDRIDIYPCNDDGTPELPEVVQK